MAASTPLVSGAAASASVTALNRDSAPTDRTKTAGVADVAKPNLPAPEAKSPAVAEQPKSANLAEARSPLAIFVPGRVILDVVALS